MKGKQEPLAASRAELSDEERAKIHAEERFRLDLREELEKTRKPLKKETGFWKWIGNCKEFFNTTLGMWILSTVLVGITSAAWQYRSSALESKRSSNREQARTLSELIYRIEGVILIVEDSPAGDSVSGSAGPLGWDNKKREYVCMHPEFVHVPVTALLSLLESSDEKRYGELVAEARDAVVTIRPVVESQERYLAPWRKTLQRFKAERSKLIKETQD